VQSSLEIIIAAAALIVSFAGTVFSILSNRRSQSAQKAALQAQQAAATTTIRPIVFCYYDEEKKWHLRNVGNAPAVNVFIRTAMGERTVKSSGKLNNLELLESTPMGVGRIAVRRKDYVIQMIVSQFVQIPPLASKEEVSLPFFGDHSHDRIELYFEDVAGKRYATITHTDLVRIEDDWKYDPMDADFSSYYGNTSGQTQLLRE
jgi:hypothetical protein